MVVKPGTGDEVTDRESLEHSGWLRAARRERSAEEPGIGKIIWGRLSHSRVLGVLKNPSYAGRYVFGRYQYRREISLDGEVRKRMQAVAMPAWRVSLKQH